MQTKFFVLVVVLFVCIGGGYLVGQSQDASQSGGSNVPLMTAPGLYHKQLDNFEGSWVFTGQVWSAKARQYEPIEGTIEYQWVLGRRFMQGMFAGRVNKSALEGLHYLGYDNFRQVYISNWMSNLATSFWTSMGSFDRAAGSLILRGLYDDLIQSKRDVPFSSVTSIQGGIMTLEMKLATEDGTQPKTLLSFTATRKEPLSP